MNTISHRILVTRNGVPLATLDAGAEASPHAHRPKNGPDNWFRLRSLHLPGRPSTELLFSPGGLCSSSFEKQLTRGHGQRCPNHARGEVKHIKNNDSLHPPNREVLGSKKGKTSKNDTGRDSDSDSKKMCCCLFCSYFNLQQHIPKVFFGEKKMLKRTRPRVSLRGPEFLTSFPVPPSCASEPPSLTEASTGSAKVVQVCPETRVNG